MADQKSITFLGQEDAQQLDVDLMSSLAFSIDQLMELAGLSVATAVSKVYGKQSHPRVLVVCGPGNNGGDGLVAARHLSHFGYTPTVCYPKASKKDLYTRLLTQCKSLDIPVVTQIPTPAEIGKDFDVVVDAIFGFSFKGSIRAPFDVVVKNVKEAGVPVAAVDIPSGWDVERGNAAGVGLLPELLISLTAPKLCAKFFEGKFHYLGGRFVPPAIVEKYKLSLPPYPGHEQCVDISYVHDQAKL